MKNETEIHCTDDNWLFGNIPERFNIDGGAGRSGCGFGRHNKRGSSYSDLFGSMCGYVGNQKNDKVAESVIKMKSIILCVLTIVLLSVNAQAVEVTCTENCRTEYEGQCNSACTARGRVFVGYHNSYESLRAALNAVACADRIDSFSTGSGASGSCPAVAGGDGWIPRLVNTDNPKEACSDYSCSGGWSYLAYGYYYTGTCTEGVDCPYDLPVTDTDGDGIDDDIDPYPDDPDPFVYQLMGYQKDGQGNVSFLCIKTHLGDTFCYGDYDPDGEIYISADHAYHDSTDLGGTTGESELAEETSLYDDYVVPIEPMDTETFEGGTDNTGNSVDTDYLEDIVSNTKDALKNQESIGTYLKGISDDIKKSNQIALDSGTQNIQVNVENDTQAPTAVEIADEIRADQEARDAIGEAETTDALDAIGSGNETYEGEFTESEIPDENLIGDIYDNFMQSNPVSTYIEGTSIDTSGAACSFTGNYNGHDLVFSICNFEPQVDLMGGILLALAGISSLLIVFRR